MFKMVKNFQGERETQIAPSKDQKNLVSDYMTSKLVTFHPDDPMIDVMNKLVKYRIAGGPVVNEQNELVGVISEGDCLKEIVARTYHNSPESIGKAKDHMTTEVTTITAQTDIFEAANKFLSLRLRRFPVLDRGKLIGQISQKDIMKAVLKLKSSTW